MRPKVIAAGCACAALALVAGQAGAATVTRTATTRSFRLTLVVGPTEAMYSKAQMKTMHPKRGQVMLGGAATAAGGHAMAMEGGMTRHLEIHVALRSDGRTVLGRLPALALADESAGAMPSPLRVVAMRGIGRGPLDVHYGNNVALVPRHRYLLVVTLKGERAQFSFRAP